MLGVKLSDNYTKILNYDKRINEIYERALQEVMGGMLFGEPISTLKQALVAFYLLYKDYNAFHERLKYDESWYDPLTK